MTTRDEMIDTIRGALASYTGQQDQVTWLAEPLGATETNPFRVMDSSIVNRGIIEIGEELIYINLVQPGAGGDELVIGGPGAGRGYRGSTPADHPLYSAVFIDPSFPRFDIGKALDQTLASLYPSLFQVKTATMPTQSVDVSYSLPADCDEVLSVEFKADNQAEDYWVPMKNWEFDGTTGAKLLNMYAGSPLQAQIRVHYRAPFGALTESFAASGIPESYNDILLYGVTSRMIRFSGVHRLQLGAVENVSRAQVVGADDAGRLANQLYAVYQSRVSEERRRLLEAHPARPNFTAR